MRTYKEYGVIVKPFTFLYGGNYGIKKGKAVLIIEPFRDMIDVVMMSDAAPMAIDIILFLLADKDVRLLIKQYQQGTRTRPYKIRESTGVSGRSDLYINFYNDLGIQTSGKKLMHISCMGKINLGWERMYAGDFAELVAYISKKAEYAELVELIAAGPKILRQKSLCRYCKGYFDEDNSASTDVSKII